MDFSWRVQSILPVIVFLVSGCIQQTVDPGQGKGIKGHLLFRVYLVRHAEAYKNIPHLPGTPEEKLDSLTPKGRRQAVAVGTYLKGKGVVAVIASPTGRTRETAEAIGNALGLDPQYSEDRAFTALTNGKTSEGRLVSWSWRENQWKAGHDPRPLGGESLADGAARAVDAIDQLVRKYSGKAAAVVTHGDICAALLGHARNTPMVRRYSLHEVRAGSISEIRITDSGWYLQRQ